MQLCSCPAAVCGLQYAPAPIPPDARQVCRQALGAGLLTPAPAHRHDGAPCWCALAVLRTCPTCDGDGYDPTAPRCRCPDRTHHPWPTCPTCEGQGRLPVNQIPSLREHAHGPR